MKKEITENLFKQYCSKNNWYCLKLQIDKSSIIAYKTNFAKNMPCDFLVFKDNSVDFVECKEVQSSDIFQNSRFKQQYRMTKLSKELNSNMYKFYILINFIKYNKCYLIPINEYNTLVESKKHIKIKDINNKYLIKLTKKHSLS